MAAGISERLEASRDKLLAAVAGSSAITFIRPYGNIGDHLIHAGTRQLLAGTPYDEVGLLQVENVRGHTAVVSGGGGWCGPFHDMPAFLPQIEERFERVIVFPSSFDVGVQSVRKWLLKTRALVFAREEVSFRQIRELCNADIALDGAFFFDFSPYKRSAGLGVLSAFRTDGEAAGGDVPPGNNDISLTCESLDEWLWTIARHSVVQTDRAHVTIAAAMLGKRVEYRSSNYHKVPAIVDFSLLGFPVYRMSEECRCETDPSRPENEKSAPNKPLSGPEGHTPWIQTLRMMVQDLAELIPEGVTFLFVDDAKVGSLPLFGRRRVPFLERDGQYWGPPTNDGEAIRELARLRESGAAFMVFAWPAFWWLDYYGGLHQHLRSEFRCVLQNDRLIAFDLRS